VIPSTPYDAKGLLRSSIRDNDPVLFFEHKKMYRSVRGDVPETDFVVPLGKAAITHPGTQITCIAYGLMAHYALEAADIVAEEDISVEVVDLRTLRPLDKETVLSSVKKTGKCLIVYEDNRFLGYGAVRGDRRLEERSSLDRARGVLLDRDLVGRQASPGGVERFADDGDQRRLDTDPPGKCVSRGAKADRRSVVAGARCKRPEPLD